MIIKIRINHNMQEFETNRVELILGDKEFTITSGDLNSFDVNKGFSGSIKIKPNVSNSITIE